MFASEWLAKIKKILPQTFWGLLENNDGWEIFQAIAAAAQRIEASITNTINDYNILLAKGGAYTYLYVTYQNNTTAPITIAHTDPLTTEIGYNFFPVGGSYIVPASSTAIVHYKAERQGSEYNYIAAYDKWVLPTTGITIIDIMLSVYGNDSDIDTLAAERAISRLTGETDDELRVRIRSIADTITLPDIKQYIINNNITADIYEWGDVIDWQLPFVGQGFVGQTQVVNCSMYPGMIIYVKSGSESDIQNLTVDIANNKAAGVKLIMEDVSTMVITPSKGDDL